jgi:RNA-directed DNA polymerase
MALFERLCDPERLDQIARATARGKRRRPDVAAFLFERERDLRGIADALRQEAWRAKPFQLLWIRDPKPRVIARAPFLDRIVHAAVASLVEPVFARSLSDCDFACRKRFGTHRAVLRLLQLMQRHRFAVHLDIRSYFPSIDPGRVLAQLSRRIRDARFLAVVEHILESGRGIYDSPRVRAHAGMSEDWPPRGRGLPIGAVTSQLFAAHVHLMHFDHFVKRELRVPGYLRYVDDIFLFGDRRSDLRAWRAAVGEYLHRELELRLKHPAARVLSCRGSLDGLGYRIRREGVEPLPDGWRRWRGRIGAHLRGEGSAREELAASLASRSAHLFFPFRGNP